jgi:hypothetical protein
VETLPTLISNSRRELAEIQAHWEEGLVLGSVELCSVVIASLMLHAAFSLPELVALLEAELLQPPLLR